MTNSKIMNLVSANESLRAECVKNKALLTQKDAEIERLKAERDEYLFVAHGPKCHQCWWGRRNTPAECSGVYPGSRDLVIVSEYSFCNSCAKDQGIEDRKPIDREQWIREYLEKRNDR